MSGASAVSQTPARRAQPTLVFRQIVPPVQPSHALGAALVEGRGECLFAGLVTTARSCPFHDFVTPWHNVRMPDLGRLPPREPSRRWTIAQKERRLLTIVSNGHPALTAERLGRSHEIMRERAHSRPKASAHARGLPPEPGFLRSTLVRRETRFEATWCLTFPSTNCRIGA